MQQDMLEIQVERHVRDCEIDAKRVIMRVCQTKPVDRNRTEERCIDLVDINSKALLTRSPPNPPPNAMGNREWCKPDRQQRREQKKQTNQRKSTLEEHWLDEG